MISDVVCVEDVLAPLDAWDCRDSISLFWDVTTLLRDETAVLSEEICELWDVMVGVTVK